MDRILGAEGGNTTRYIERLCSMLSSAATSLQLLCYFSPITCMLAVRQIEQRCTHSSLFY